MLVAVSSTRAESAEPLMTLALRQNDNKGELYSERELHPTVPGTHQSPSMVKKQYTEHSQTVLHILYPATLLSWY